MRSRSGWAMATCGEDEFGNLYADVRKEDVGALRGYGSLYWSYEDESDSSTDIASRKVRTKLLSGDCHAGATTRAQSKFVMEEEGKATFIQSGTCNGVSPARGASKHDNLTGIANSKHCLRDAGGATIGAQDVDTDSDDDLHIVLNPLQVVVNEGSGEDSEDGEDFVILAGNAAMNDREWQEESCIPLEDKAQPLLEGGEKLGTLGDEKGQNGKSPRVQPRVGYGSQVYHRHYRYVRGSGPSSVEASVSARVDGKPDRFGGRQRVSLPSRGTGTFRGLSCGLEYCIPSNKTVFDVDIDALMEKPWRLSHVDVSDYFNFGFDEISWKKYCKQLAQFCMEITTQSKISVYEGGRSGQSTTGALQVAGGCEPWSSANTQGQQIRESDAIFLIDVKADHLPQGCTEGHSVDSWEVNNLFKNGSPKSDVSLGSERGIRTTAQPTVEYATQTSVTRLGAEPQNCGASSGNETQVDGSVAICGGEGSITPAVSRPKTLSPSTPPERIPTQDKRDIERGKSLSSSLNDGSPIAHENDVSGSFHRNDNVERKENLQFSDYVKACGRRRVNAALTFCADNCLSGRLSMKRGSSCAISSPLSKKQRLGPHKVNHGAYRSIQVIKKLCRPHTATEVLGAYKAYAKAEITQQKKHMSINNAVEHLNDNKSVGQYMNGYNEQHFVEKTDSKENSLSFKTESKKSKGHGETDSSKIKGQLQDIRCEPAEEKSKEKHKAKKCRKGRKHKERIESKGCPNIEKGQVVEGFDKALLMKKQGTGSMSLIGFVSKDNGYYWKNVENMSLGHIQGQDAKELKSFQCHEIEQNTEGKKKTHKSNNCLLGHLEIGGDEEFRNEVLKLDGNTQREAVNSWKASWVLKSKKMDVKHMLSGKYRVALAKTGSLASSIFEAHARESMHVAFSEQVSTRQKQKFSESKERQVICKHSHLEAEEKAKGLTDLAKANEQSRTKHRSKKLRKSSRRNSNQPSITCLAGQQKQSSSTLNLDLVKDVKLMSGKNGASSTLTCGKAVNSSDLDDKHRKIDSEICQSETHSPKACGSKLPYFSTDTLNGSSYVGVGFDRRRKLPNVSTDTLNGNSYIGFDISRLHENHSPAEGLFVEQESVHATLSESSQEEVKQRGRSKFERWTSHSEQITQDSCLSLSDMQKVGRISLSGKVPASNFGQCLKHSDESAPECTKQGDNCGLQSGAGKNWMAARKYKGKLSMTFEEADNLTVRKNEHRSAQQHLEPFVAKLEKRRERFKLSMTGETEAIKDERESLPKSAIKAPPVIDRVVVRLERPARKRCWGGG